jgi:nitrous oxide reductase
MSSQDAKRASDPEPSGSPGRRLSRRSLLQGAATAGAAGLAATAIGAAASPALAATSRASAAGQQHSHDPAGTPAGPIMVHVRDAKSGDIEVFSGTSQTRLRDQDLAARIARAIG